MARRTEPISLRDRTADAQGAVVVLELLVADFVDSRADEQVPRFVVRPPGNRADRSGGGSDDRHAAVPLEVDARMALRSMRMIDRLAHGNQTVRLVARGK